MLYLFIQISKIVVLEALVYLFVYTKQEWKCFFLDCI